MRRREPMSIDRTWQHSVPVPMPNRPVCVTEHEAINQLARLPRPPRMFLWTDSERRCLPNWGYIASVRQGVPPEGIEAELNAWMGQYPDAWLAVDMVFSSAPWLRFDASHQYFFGPDKISKSGCWRKRRDAAKAYSRA